MKPQDDVNKFYRKAAVNTNPQVDKAVLNRILKACGKTSQTKTMQNGVGKIMKKLPIKISIAAAIIIVSVIFYVKVNQRNDNNKPAPLAIVIPQELTSMSVEDLLALNYHPEKSSYDPNLVQAALKQALDKMDSIQVMAVARAFGGLDVSQGRGARGQILATERVGGFGGGVGREYPVTADISFLLINLQLELSYRKHRIFSLIAVFWV